MKPNPIKNKLAKITVEKEENFSLLGIISPKPIYKVAFLLNKSLNTNFVLYNNEHIEFSLPNLPEIYFSNEIDRSWYLFKNNFQRKANLKDYDYFLIGYPKISQRETQDLLVQIHTIEDIVITNIIEQRKEIVNLFSSIL